MAAVLEPQAQPVPAKPRDWRCRTPTVLQMEAVECGAAALAIILAYYKRIVPLETLRMACGVSRDGSKASNVVKAARSYGLEAKGMRREPNSLRELGQPAIVFWNFNHFLVLEGFKGNKVYLNDPGSGPRVVTFEEFDQSFTGVVLTMQPGPDFQPGGKPPSMLQALRDRLEGSRSSVLFLILVGLALVIPGLLVPIFTKVFVDEFLIGRMDSWVRPLLLAMGVTLLAMAALTWMQEYALVRLRAKLAITGASRFLWHVLRLPLVFYSQRSAGEISGRVGINSRVADVLAGDLAASALSVMMVVFYAVLMLFFDVFLTLVAIAVAALNIVALRFVARKREDGNQRLLMDAGKLAGTSMNGLRAIESLKASGTESDFFARWSGYHAKTLNAQQNLGRSTLLLLAVPPLLTALNTALILSFGGYRVMQGYLTIGGLMAFQTLMQSFINPINKLISVGSTIQEMTGDMKRLDDVLEYEPDPGIPFAGIEAGEDAADREPAAQAEQSKLAGYLELRDITYGFSPHEPPLFENFNLKLGPGQRVALVGPSGCGKSTLSKLVLGLFQPWSGEVLFDGRRREEIPRQVLLNSLSMVDQEIAVFDGTIRDNLTMWDHTIPDARVIQAAKDACIHDVISARQGGYDSEVREGGVNFSGGQRQRLEIARALVTNPTLLVLDEATSALDTVTELTVDDNLRRRGCACLIVAHRLSTIRDCDEIVVLDRGKVVQRGTHDEMGGVDGPYQRLIQTL